MKISLGNKGPQFPHLHLAHEVFLRLVKPPTFRLMTKDMLLYSLMSGNKNPRPHSTPTNALS